jgi:DNA-binding response OmpR family regulator
MSEGLVTGVLVVEDDESARAMIIHYLTRHGLAAMGARSGLDAWTLLSERRFEVVVLDLMLPGLSGPELLSRIRGATESLRSVSVIIASAASDNDRQIECLRLGADDFVAKPYSLGLLQARVQAQFRRRAFPGPDAGPQQRYVHVGALDGALVPTWMGRHKATGQAVEVKAATIPSELTDTLERLWRDQSLPQPPGVVRIVDAGRSKDGVSWWITEALPGRPLTENWGFATDRGIAVIGSLLNLLVHLERVGWLPHRLEHTDMSVDDDGQLWLRDVGVAPFVDDEEHEGELASVLNLGRHLCVMEELLSSLGSAGSLAAAAERFRRVVSGR